MDIEVLVTTMHQTDLNKYKEMNLQTNAVIANQTDYFSYIEEKIDNSVVKMISTKTIGTSRNRNIALEMSTAEYIVFADDDLQFIDGYEDIIEKEFNQHPGIDAIKFNLYDISSTRKISMNRITKFEKATIRNMGASGVWGLVIKREVIDQLNLRFNEKFGPGTDNYCGEDTIFLFELIRKKVKFYRSTEIIAGIDQTESTWFEGLNSKYFEVSGKMFKQSFGILAYLIVLRSAYRFSKNKSCNMSFLDILKCYLSGVRKGI